jgi:hypothetical protein
MLEHRIKRVCRAQGIPFSRFGRDVMGDPTFVYELANGRIAQPKTERRVLAVSRRGGASCLR